MAIFAAVLVVASLDPRCARSEARAASPAQEAVTETIGDRGDTARDADEPKEDGEPKAADGAKADGPPEMDPLSARFLFPSPVWIREPRDVGLQAERVRFVNRGGHELTGWWFDRPGVDETILVCGGNAGNMSYFLPWAGFLSERFDVLLFEYQGFGRSAGTASIVSLPGDALRAYDFLVTELGKKPEDIGVLGISLGSVLAVGVASLRTTSAIVVEDLFLPSAKLDELESNLDEGDRALRFAVRGIRTLALPAVDPLAKLPKIDTPILFIHGEDDWLLPPSHTIAAAKVAKGPKRVWFLEDVGHSPESIELEDPEYRHQILDFFSTVFSGGRLEDPAATLAVETNAADVPTAVVTIESPRDAFVQVTLTGGDGEFDFERPRVPKGRSEWRFPVPFEPKEVFVVACHNASPDVDDPRRWEPERSELAQSLRAYFGFEREFRATRRGEPEVYRVPGFTALVRRYAPEDAMRLLEKLPEAEKVHAHVRPRYARIIALLWIGLPRASSSAADAIAERLIPFLPEDPSSHYELGNGSFRLGLEDLAIAEALWSLAAKRREASDLEEAVRLLRLYLDILPEGPEPRITRQAVEALAGRSSTR